MERGGPAGEDSYDQLVIDCTLFWRLAKATEGMEKTGAVAAR